jgi:hypothetical protein
MAGAQLGGCGAHALHNEALQFGMDGAIFGGACDNSGRLTGGLAHRPRHRAIGGWMWGGTDEVESVSTIRAALERVVNLVDTASVCGFGRSEAIVGKAVAEGNLRSRTIIATKTGLEWRLVGRRITFLLSMVVTSSLAFFRRRPSGYSKASPTSRRWNRPMSCPTPALPLASTLSPPCPF